jgi:hypothetical protein
MRTLHSPGDIKGAIKIPGKIATNSTEIRTGYHKAGYSVLIVPLQVAVSAGGDIWPCTVSKFLSSQVLLTTFKLLPVVHLSIRVTGTALQ